MEKKELMNEESYQKTKHNLIILSFVILLIGLVLGISLIFGGIMLTKNVKDKTQNEINAIQPKIDDLKAQLEVKEAECRSSITESNENWFNDSSNCTMEAMDIRTQITDLENEQKKFQREYEDVGYSYAFMYVLAAFAILISIFIFIIIFIRAKGRDMAAFIGQSYMPLAQEGIEKMTPTVAKASGTMGKEVAKGITQGIKEGLNSNQDSNNNNNV